MLEMQNVTKTFGGFTALSELSMRVPKGAVYGLVGPNGAGKSTAIRLLTGVYRPDRGNITMDGQPVYENPDVKARMAYIPDEIFFFPAATLEEMRKYYKGFYPHFNDELFNKLYEVFQLPKKTQIRRFSKGMQKQAAFHLSICTRPDVMILDEPVDGLDPVMRRQVWSLILSDVAQRETTVLISSHNLRELEDICDHVGLLHKGGILFSKDLESMKLGIYKLQCVFKTSSDITALSDAFPVIHQEMRGSLYTVTLRGSREEIDAKMESLSPVFYELLPLSLEEIFITETEVAGYDFKELYL